MLKGILGIHISIVDSALDDVLFIGREIGGKTLIELRAFLLKFCGAVHISDSLGVLKIEKLTHEHILEKAIRLDLVQWRL